MQQRNARPSALARSLFDQGKAAQAVAQMRKDGIRLTVKGRAALRKAISHGEKAETVWRGVLADSRKMDDCLTPSTISQVDTLVTSTRRMVDDMCAILADDGQSKAAKILNTWAAADERRF